MVGKFITALHPHTIEGVQYHIRCKPGDVAPYVLLPGDPDRVPRIAKYWDEAREVSRHRCYVTFTGLYKGAPISATSTGIGCPSTAIALEELLRIGANTFIRVGTTGSINANIKVGDLIISSGAVRLEGTSRQYVAIEYPAVASYEVLLALIEASESLGVRYHVGLTASTDSFYVGQARPGFKNYLPSWTENLISDLQACGVLNFEMEASTIFTLSSIYGVRAGSICAVLANRVTDEFSEDAGVEDCIRVANEAVKILYDWDCLKASKGKRYFHPSMLLNP